MFVAGRARFISANWAGSGTVGSALEPASSIGQRIRAATRTGLNSHRSGANVQVMSSCTHWRCAGVVACCSHVLRSVGPASEITQARLGRSTASIMASHPPAEMPSAQIGTPGWRLRNQS